MKYILCVLGILYGGYVVQATTWFPLKSATYEAGLYTLSGDGQHIAGDATAVLPLVSFAQKTAYIFFEPRFMMYTNNIWELNAAVGHRRLFGPAKNGFYGFYAVYDGRHTSESTYFNQATVGTEIRYNQIFGSINGYIPIGTVDVANSSASSGKRKQLTDYAYIPYVNLEREQAMYGGDLTAGYTVVRNFDLYAKTYAFGSADVDTYVGAGLGARYTWNAHMGIMQALKFNVIANYDKQNKFIGMFGVQLNVSGENHLAGNTPALRHFYDPITRDFDIRVHKTTREQEIKTLDGKPVVVVEATTFAELQARIKAVQGKTLAGLETGDIEALIIVPIQTYMGNSDWFEGAPDNINLYVVSTVSKGAFAIVSDKEGNFSNVYDYKGKLESPRADNSFNANKDNDLPFSESDLSKMINAACNFTFKEAFTDTNMPATPECNGVAISSND